MSALPVETTEPDPAATSLPNDEMVNKSADDSSATANKDTKISAARTEDVKEANGSAEVKEGKGSQEVEKNGDVKNAEEKKEESTKQDNNEDEHGSRPPNREHKKYNKGPNRSKYDASVLEPSNDHKQIRAQVEFYFSDSNLPTDQFLWDLTDGGANLPVPIFTICKFKRMQRFKDYSTVVEALRNSQFLVVSGEKGSETVKRKFAYDPNAARPKSLSRSIYAKGFGEEESSYQFDIEAFFATFGPTNAVRLRRNADKSFKGSVFVEFADEEDARRFIELDPKPKWKGKHELEIKWKEEYMKGKEDDIREGRLDPSESYIQRGVRGGRSNNSRGFRGNGRGRGDRGRGDRDRGRDRGDRDPDDWKKRREEDRASGFKNDRKNDRGGRGGKNRGGQRGGHRGGRDEQSKNGDSSKAKKEETEERAIDEEKAEIKPEIENAEKAEKPAVNEKKRAREDDDVSEQAPAKKVDVKGEAL